MNLRFEATGNMLTAPATIVGDQVHVPNKGGCNVYELRQQFSDATVVGKFIEWKANA